MKNNSLNAKEFREKWSIWIKTETKSGRSRNEAEYLAILLPLCNIFRIQPEDMGIVRWPGGGKILGTTHKTVLILAHLILCLIADRIEDPPAVPCPDKS